MHPARRPLIIWLSLVFLAVVVLLNLVMLYGAADQAMHSGAAARIAFVLEIGLEVLLIVTLDAIKRGSGLGQQLGILSFSMLAVFSVFNAVAYLALFGINGSEYGMVPIVLVMTRLGISFILAIAFGISRDVDRYFAEGTGPQGQVKRQK